MMRLYGLLLMGAALAACGDDTTRFESDAAVADVPLPPRDAPGSDRPDRETFDVLDLTDVDFTPDGSTSDVPCVAMLPATIRFGFEGGLSPTVDSFSLEPALTFRAERRSGMTVSARCATTIPSCGVQGMVGIADVREALANRQVEIAFGMARGMPVLVGYDARPADGQVFVVERDGARILVGDTCRVGGGGGPCNEIPTGIQRLTDVLRALRDQELLRAECTAFRRL